MKKDDSNYVNSVSEILQGVIDEFKEENKDLPSKEGDKVITIKALLKNCVFGLQGTDVEKNFYSELLNEWAKKEFKDREETIKFDLKIENVSDTLKENIMSFLYLKSSEYDIIMMDIVWVGQFKDYLLNLQSYVSSDLTKLFKSSILNSCKSDNKLIALVNYIHIYIYKIKILFKNYIF